MKLVKLTLKKTGKVIEVLPREVLQLRNAGLLKEGKAETTSKEEKGKTQTKEEKITGETKLDAGAKSDNEPDASAEAAAQAEKEAAEAVAQEAKKAQEAKEQMTPKSNRPVNISHKNIKQG